MESQNKPIGKLLDGELEKKNSGLILAGAFLLSLIVAFILKDAGGRGVSVPVFFTASYVLLALIFGRTKRAFSVGSLLLAAANLLVAFSFLFVDSSYGNMIAGVFLAVSFPLHISYMAHPDSKIFSIENTMEMLYAMFGKVFLCLGAPFKTVFGKKTSRRRGLLAVVGVVTAVPVTAILLALLSSADSRFGDAVARLFRNISVLDVFVDIFIIVAFTLFFVSFIYALCVDRDNTVFAGERRGGIAGAAVIGFLAPIILLETVYVAFQFSFLFSGSILPEGYTYASYLHNGFGSSAAASTITAIIVILVYAFCKRKNDRLPVTVKLLLTVMNLCNFVIIASSLLRVFMYVSVYGLTVPRIVVFWFEILLAVIMLVFMVKIWSERFNVLGAVGAVTAAFVILIAFANPDVICAKYNVDKYFDYYSEIGDRASIDIGYLSRLSGPAQLELDRLTASKDQKVAKRAEKALYNYTSFVYSEHDWRGFCVSDTQVAGLVEKYPPMEEDEFYDRYEQYGYNGYDYQSGEETVDYISEHTGIELTEPEYVSFREDHALNGVGFVYSEVTLNYNDTEVIRQRMNDSGVWHRSPIPKKLDLLLYGGKDDGIDDRNVRTGWHSIPKIQNGYWFFRDRTEGYEADGVANLFVSGRTGYNYTAAVYDADSYTIYYLEFDS